MGRPSTLGFTAHCEISSTTKVLAKRMLKYHRISECSSPVCPLGTTTSLTSSQGHQQRDTALQLFVMLEGADIPAAQHRQSGLSSARQQAFATTGTSPA